MIHHTNMLEIRLAFIGKRIDTPVGAFPNSRYLYIYPILLFIHLCMLNTNLSAQQSMPCDTFALDSLSLPRFIICPNQEKRYTKKELEQMVLLGGAYFELFEVEDAKKIFQEIIRTESSFKYSHSIADAHNYLGVIADMEEDWISAYFYFHKLLKWEKDNNVGLNVSAYLNMGALYSDLGDDGKAAQYLKKALSLSEENTVEKGWLLYHLVFYEYTIGKSL